MSMRTALIAASIAWGLIACGGPRPPQDAGDPGATDRVADASQSSAPGALPGDAKGGSGASKPAPASDKPARSAPGPDAAPRFGAYLHLWTSETKDWNGGLLITEDGDVLSFSSSGVRVHAREDGRVLHRANACSPVSEDGVAFVAADRFVIVCDDEVRSFSWPKLGSKSLVTFKERVDRGAVGGGLVAVAEDGFFVKDRKGRVVVHDAADGRVVDQFIPPAEVETLALSVDGGKLLVGTRQGTQIRDLGAKRDAIWSDKHRASGAAFAPSGKTVFGDFASFEASNVDLVTQKPSKTWKVGSWLTASRWIDGMTIAATGSDGLSIFSATADTIASPISDLGEGIALSKDGGTLCAGARSGRIACFARSKPAPSTLASAFAGGSPQGAAAGGVPSRPASPELSGKILGRKGKTLEVSIDGLTSVELGATGTVSRPFQTNVGFAISGWIVIAKVKVVAATKGKLTLEIVEEKSAMSVNGRQVNHFTPGEVKLALSPPP